MKRKRNIYDADDAAKSKRLHFSAEERAAHAEKKAEILENAAAVLQALGYEHINAACICGGNLTL